MKRDDRSRAMDGKHLRIAGADTANGGEPSSEIIIAYCMGELDDTAAARVRAAAVRIPWVAEAIARTRNALNVSSPGGRRRPRPAEVATRIVPLLGEGWYADMPEPMKLAAGGDFRGPSPDLVETDGWRVAVACASGSVVDVVVEQLDGRPLGAVGVVLERVRLGEKPKRLASGITNSSGQTVLHLSEPIFPASGTECFRVVLSEPPHARH